VSVHGWKNFAEFKDALLSGGFGNTGERRTSSTPLHPHAKVPINGRQPEEQTMESISGGPIQFVPEHYNAGLSILKFFIKALHKFSPQKPEALINQNGSKLTLAINLPNGKQVIIEKDMKKIINQNKPEQDS